MMITEGFIQKHLFRKKRSSAKILMPNFTPRGWWECDLIHVTKANHWHEFEIKLSISDYQADFSKASWRQGDSKHALLEKSLEVAGLGPKTFTFVLPMELAEQIVPPAYAGLIGVDNGRRMGTKVFKASPILKSAKLEDKEITRILTCAYWRYWNIRSKS